MQKHMQRVYIGDVVLFNDGSYGLITEIDRGHEWYVVNRRGNIEKAPFSECRALTKDDAYKHFVNIITEPLP